VELAVVAAGALRLRVGAVHGREALADDGRDDGGGGGGGGTCRGGRVIGRATDRRRVIAGGGQRRRGPDGSGGGGGGRVRLRLRRRAGRRATGARRASTWTVRSSLLGQPATDGPTGALYISAVLAQSHLRYITSDDSELQRARKQRHRKH